jgi:hypothetical protein
VIRIEKLALRIQIQKQKNKNKIQKYKTKPKKKGGKQQQQVVLAVGSASKQAKCMMTDVYIHTYLRGATNAMKSTKKGAAMATQTMTYIPPSKKLSRTQHLTIFIIILLLLQHNNSSGTTTTYQVPPPVTR